MTLRLEIIPLDAIQFDPRNPRTDGEEGLEELAASIRSGDVVQPPTVTPSPEGYRILVGERRVRAARLAGLEQIPCLVREVASEIQAHRLRVVENLHRRELNPIDHAAALRVAWLADNAAAMGLTGELDALLAVPRPPVETLPDVEALLDEHGFAPSAPKVTWDETLDRLGIAMSPERRKKLLRVLAVPHDVQQVLRRTPVTEAGLRALGTLDDGDLREVAAAIADDPALASKARRIARAVRDQGYSVDEALDEARGRYTPPESPETDASVSFAGDQAVTDAVLRVLEQANAFLDALDVLRELAPDPLDIPDPWRNFYRNALNNLVEEIGA